MDSGFEFRLSEQTRRELQERTRGVGLSTSNLARIGVNLVLEQDAVRLPRLPAAEGRR
jgi:hypothetical protein